MNHASVEINLPSLYQAARLPTSQTCIEHEHGSKIKIVVTYHSFGGTDLPLFNGIMCFALPHGPLELAAGIALDRAIVHRRLKNLLHCCAVLLDRGSTFSCLSVIYELHVGRRDVPQCFTADHMSGVLKMMDIRLEGRFIAAGFVSMHPSGGIMEKRQASQFGTNACLQRPLVFVTLAVCISLRAP